MYESVHATHLGQGVGRVVGKSAERGSQNFYPKGNQDFAVLMLTS